MERHPLWFACQAGKIEPADIERAIQHGMIPKDKLESGWYRGIHRCTKIAYWDAKKDSFFYMENSWGNWITEKTKYPDSPELAENIACFLPLEKLDLEPKEFMRR
jgi:hypothetical protein